MPITMRNREKKSEKILQRNRKIFMRIAGVVMPLSLFSLLKICLGAIGISWLSTYASAELLVSEICILLFMSSAIMLGLKCNSFMFSLGAVCALSPLIALNVCPDASSVMLLFMSSFFGCLLGLISGGARMITRLPVAQCSLCMCLIYEGTAFLFEQNGRYTVPDNNYFGGMRSFFICIVIFEIFFWLLMNKTVYGYNWRAVAINGKIAKAVQVDCEQNLFYTYILSGGLMGASGFMLFVREGESIGAGLNFVSVRILFFALLPLFIGRLLSKFIGGWAGNLFGAVCAAMIYSAGREIGFSENTNIVVCSAVLLVILIYLSNEKNFFFRIHTKKISEKI